MTTFRLSSFLYAVSAVFSFAAILTASAPAAIAVEDLIEFNRDIRPILNDACFACHGPDSASRKADLRLDKRDAALEHGAIEAGKPEDSEMIARIFSDDPELVMPPPELKKTLTSEQKQLLSEWIRQGAVYQQHWSYIAPVRPAVPDVPDSLRGTHAAWPKNSIDHFVLRALAENGLTPAPEADRKTLARRASLDITGLPPTPEQVEEFLKDSSTDAYEKYVDRLLQSPHWGEHRGRYWLDYARYADTHGIHFDNYREMWAYRDWVIRAFNRNMPFDQFTVENIAGDLIPGATLDQKIASGFNRCNMTTNEGGIIDEEYAVLYTRDRTETVSTVWMGLTAGCATCHSHKFDELSHKEFYELSAFFNNTTQPVRDGNIKDTPPVIPVPMEADRPRFEALPPLIAAARAAVEERRSAARPDFDMWLTSATAENLAPVSADGLHLHAPLNEGEGRTLHFQFDGQPSEVTLQDSAQWQDGPGGKSLGVQGAAFDLAAAGDFEADQPFSAAAWVKVPANDGGGAIAARMESGPGYRGWDLWMQQRRIGMHIISAWPDNALKVVSKAQIPANEWVHVAVTYDGSRKASGLQIFINGAVQEKNVENDRLKPDATIRTQTAWRIGQRAVSESFTGALQDFRIHRRVLSAAEVDSLAKLSRFQATLAKAADQRTEQEVSDLYAWWLNKSDALFIERTAALASLQKEEADIRARGTIAHVMNERNEPATAFVLFRGEYDQRREQVSPATPAVFPAFPEAAPRNRLGLAQWLLSPEHPLTARVTVNRFWQEVFGTGIVRTTGDLGVSGELPSNQELLDWMAVDFRETGWDVKKLIRLMVTSATYRQSAEVTPEKLNKDPDNRLLSRGPRFRMDAEMVRDNALAVSGLLVPKLGGPSVRPYQPEGVWESIAMIGSTTQRYTRDSGDSLYRRSLYTFVKRMAPPASLDIFNSPNRETCTVRRERTNTPLQALVTMNDEQFVEAARRFAENILRQNGGDSERLQWAARRLLSREWTAEELTILQDSLEQLNAFYRDHVKEAGELISTGESRPDAGLDAVTLATWTMLCNQMMNLDEVLNK